MPQPLEVELSWSDVRLVASIATERNIRELQGSGTHFTRSGLSSWGIHIEGILAEVAVARALGVEPWNDILDADRSFDLSYKRHKLEIRSGIRGRRLIMRPKDKNRCKDKIMVLVTGQAPKYKVWGWIHGSDVPRQTNWEARPSNGGKPYWWVDRDALNPMEDL